MRIPAFLHFGPAFSNSKKAKTSEEHLLSCCQAFGNEISDTVQEKRELELTRSKSVVGGVGLLKDIEPRRIRYNISGFAQGLSGRCIGSHYFQDLARIIGPISLGEGCLRVEALLVPHCPIYLWCNPSSCMRS